MSAVISEAGPLAHGAEVERSLARPGWLVVLTKARVDELQAAWDALADKPRYRMLRHAETGLLMVRGRIAGAGQQFNLGEMTMTRAAVQLLDDVGDAQQTGFGHVAGRSARHAELVAVFDALLQDPQRHDAVAAGVVAPLAARQRATKAAQAAKVAATRVDFFTMVRGE
jgi:alpha-D-ribose 1-methylphosphonate 5-triphosphate synthase subunit PhnG